MKTIKKYKFTKQLIISIIIYLIIQSLLLISPFLMGLIIDDFIPNKNNIAIIVGIILFVTIPFISIILQTIYNYLLIKYIRKKGNEMAIQIMKNLVNKEYQFFDQENSLELLSYSSKEAVSYIDFVISDLSKFYVYIISSIVIFIIVLLLNPILALIQLAFYPLAYYPVKLIMRGVDNEIQEVLKENAQINQIKGDVFKAIEFIKLSRIEDKKIKEVEIHNNKINKIWGKVAALDSMSGIWSSGFITVLFTGITFAVGAIMLLNNYHDFKVGQLVSIVTYVGMMYSYFNTILQIDINRSKKEAEFSKVFEYLELKGEKEENLNKQPMVFNHCIEFRNCNFKYNEETLVLNNLNITFEQGKWTALVGASGSGKSTIFDLIMKLYSVDDNTIFIDDVDISQINSFDIRSKITKITQDIYLFPGTIEDNLLLVRDNITEEEIKEAIHFACLDEYIASLPKGLKTDVGEAGKLMSGGEKQRLSIAMGILRNTKILLLDEVTSNLDKEVEHRLTLNFKKLMDLGYTIVSISHKKEFLEYVDYTYTLTKNNNTNEGAVK